jgi:hypothetical protein
MTNQLPNLRNNLGTWAVPVEQIPAISRAMLEALPAEAHDAGFTGQELTTTYFDTPRLELRRNRRTHDKYITLRVRCYRGEGGEAYALSAKTEQEKFRLEIDGATAELLAGGDDALSLFAPLLPGHLFARLAEVAHGRGLGPVVRIACRRYAREDDQDRLTLDVGIRTDTGRRLPHAVCEFKSTATDEPAPACLARIPIRPMKLSKFLWALDV